MTSDYQKKKQFFDNILTIYGRKPVLEALQDNSLDIYKLHLADSNKTAGIIDQIIQLAEARKIDIEWHNKQALSRISKNSKQDQGVAADILCQKFHTLESFKEKFLSSNQKRFFSLLAIDGVTNPQNLGMIIRSACAGQIDGIILPSVGTATIGPLVIKASAGSLFKTNIIRCHHLAETLKKLTDNNTSICTLSSHATESLFDFQAEGNIIYVLGNESEGVSNEVLQLSNKSLMIPMNNGVESLNVAVTAALIAFIPQACATQT